MYTLAAGKGHMDQTNRGFGALGCQSVARCALLLCAWGVAEAGEPASAQSIPSVPADSHFIQDYADILPEPARAQIGSLQESAFQEHDTPIMVVTVKAKADYGYADASIEAFARAWFDAWQIGKRRADGTLVNRGMLLLVSVTDREARIELGADWGRSGDERSGVIMDTRILPEFRQQRFAEGIVSGVDALSWMAAHSEEPLATSFQRDAKDIAEALVGNSPLPTTPLPMWMVFWTFVLGVFVIMGSFVFTDPIVARGVRMAGIALIVLALLLWIALLIAAFLLNRHGKKAGGGFASSGGFGTGGSSGGGGASGRW